MENLNLKYRPKSFAEVVGQPVITSILSRQAETRTFRHAYLFCGPSGCGKTTVARIMAYVINKGEGAPIEMDAASNNGVDYIRELSIDAQQTALDAEFKVYIIDECHQLTNAAWNAGLKMIEEPPSNVIFIFCTTNPEKIPETILTRVQRFDFNRIDLSVIADRLEFILNEEIDNAVFERSALDRIAVLSDGYMREAISLLDKCLSYSNDITLKNVEKVLGLVEYELLINYSNAIVDKDSFKANEYLAKLKSQNSNKLNIMNEILSFFINCAKYKKYSSLKYTTIPTDYIDSIKISDDIMFFVDRAFRYRTLCNTLSVENILDILTLELCGR